MKGLTQMSDSNRPNSFLINDDCLNAMSYMSDGLIDLTVTSPPYDNLRDYKGHEWNEGVWKQALKELYRVTKQGGVLVWIVGDAVVKGSETGTSFKQALHAIDCGFRLHDTMIWEKPHFSNPSSNRCHQIFEYMFIFSKGKPNTFNQIKDVPIKYGKPVGKSSQRHKDGSITNTVAKGSKGEFGARKNIWKINSAGQENFGKKVSHPAQFSLKLAKDHVLSWSNEGDLVFDCFSGAGTVGLASKQLKRRFIGVEIAEQYHRIAMERIGLTDSDMQIPMPIKPVNNHESAELSDNYLVVDANGIVYEAFYDFDSSAWMGAEDDKEVAGVIDFMSHCY